MDALLGAVWLYSADVPRAVGFYRDSVGLPLVEEEDHAVHFDAGNIRLSIHPAHGGEPTGNDAFYVFIVENIDATVAELSSRGVTFEGKISEKGFGRVIEFRDPDGHQLYLWQIPREGEPEYERVKGLARHYARVRAALGR